MKTLFFVQSFLLATAAFSLTETVTIHPSEVHVPMGFDSNDNAEIIVTGLMRDTCHRRPTGKVHVKDHEITVDMKADKVSGREVYCIKAMVPYMVSVPLGQLGKGRYNVSVGTDTVKSHSLQIGSPGAASIDNFTYANVTSVTKNVENGSITLSGEHPSNCMAIERVEVIANETKDTMSVLPIVTQTGEVCNLVMTPFSVDVPLEASVANSAVFHVRKLDGTAINFRW